MSDATARAAIYDAAQAIAKAGAERGGSAGAAMVLQAAYAFRAATGGPQPGSPFVDGK